MSGCQTCGGFGMHHDPIAHGAEPEEPAPACITDWLCLPGAHLRFGECEEMSTDKGCAECTPDGNGPCVHGCRTAQPRPFREVPPRIAPAQSGDVLDDLWWSATQSCRRCGHSYGWRGGISFGAICDLGRRIREHYTTAHPGIEVNG